MVAIAHKWRRTLASLNIRRRLPEPVNDNGTPEDLLAYVKNCDTYAGSEYRPARTQLRWLP